MNSLSCCFSCEVPGGVLRHRAAHPSVGRQTPAAIDRNSALGNNHPEREPSFDNRTYRAHRTVQAEGRSGVNANGTARIRDGGRSYREDDMAKNQIIAFA